MSKPAFTLAEVLLTLAIIGVVAALTIPAVITKVIQDQYVVGLKKAYNTLKEVESGAIQDYGPMESWSWEGTQSDFDKYFKPHFDILKDCGSDSDDGCMDVSYKRLNTQLAAGYNSLVDVRRIITSDGIAFAYSEESFTSPSLQVASIWVDLNGKKGPNIFGRDMHRFNVYSSSLGIKPDGSYKTDGEPLGISDDCSSVGSGGYCASKVLSEGAMNY